MMYCMIPKNVNNTTNLDSMLQVADSMVSVAAVTSQWTTSSQPSVTSLVAIQVLVDSVALAEAEAEHSMCNTEVPIYV